MLTPKTILIIGAGQTGAVAARTLRDLGYDGRITIIGNEPHLPYERPPLSKAALEQSVDPAIGRLYPAEFYSEQDIEVINGVSAQSLDTQRREVGLSDGRTLTYDACLLATGGRAKQLPMLPRSSAVHTLRTLDDAMTLGSALKPGVRLVVIGGGFLGLEAGWSAKQRGAHVTVLEGGPALLGRVLPAQVSHWLSQRAGAMGLDVRLGVAVTSVLADDAAGGKTAITLDDGKVIDADHVLVSVGLTPNTVLAQAANLSICASTGGVLVDKHCRTSNEYIWAAGDCASQYQAPGDMPVRVESWQNANTQAAIAAAAILNAARPAIPYPWFWTDQLGCNIQILGAPSPGLEYVLRGDAAPDDPVPKCLYLGLRDGVPVHGVAINAGGDLRVLRPLFEQSVRIRAEVFADTATGLKPFVKSCMAQPA